MTIGEFRDSILSGKTPAGLSQTLLALWHDAHGDWDLAHRLAQDDEGIDGSRVHAYLHRKEGDDPNARYWYTRAKQPPAKGTLEEEWEDLVNDFLTRTTTIGTGAE